MLDVKTFISLVLKKKKMTYEELCRRMNIVKNRLGDKGIVRVNNISEMLNDTKSIDERTLLIMEVAMELKMDDLVTLGKRTLTLSTKRQNKELREFLKANKFYF